MTILIADSGSSKTDWVWLDANKNRTFFSSKGLNPHFLSKEEISESVADLVMDNIREIKIDKVFFYGAGSGNISNKKILSDVFDQIFPEAKVYIETDLLAAVIACFGKSEGIACVLGTGSNACVYDGEKIIKEIPSLGFVLGDEGSGGYFGKQLLNSYYYKTMPLELREVIESKTNMDLDSVLYRVYKQPQANKFVASFIETMNAFKDHTFIKEMVREGFEDFADKQLSYFEESRSLSIGFVGSIASAFEDVLREVLKERGMQVSVIVRNPLEKLADYHINQLR